MPEIVAPQDLPPMTQPNASMLKPAPAEIAELYRRAFAQYRTQALWNIRQVETPTLAEALAITRQLRTEGDMGARAIAEQIEQVASAHF